MSRQWNLARNFPGRAAQDGQSQGDVLAPRQRVQQVAVLKDKAEPLPPEPGESPPGQAGDVLPVDENLSGGDGVNGGDAVEQGGLSAARGPHDAHKLPGPDREAQIVNGPRHIAADAVVFLQMGDPQNGFLHSVSLLC